MTTNNKTTLSIKVKIFDRIYPMQIDDKDEFIIREAAKKINNKILDYKTLYKTDDRQDLLSIISLEFLIEFEKFKKKTTNSLKTINFNLEKLQTNFNEIKKIDAYF